MSKLETKRFVIRKSLIGKNTVITFVNKESRGSTCQLKISHKQYYYFYKCNTTNNG